MSALPKTRSSSQASQKAMVGNYLLGRTIGRGTFGKVKLATHIQTDEKVAVKILEKDKIVDASDVERISREISILKKIRHVNIIQLYEEFASGGELFDYIVAHNRVKEKEACRFLQQLLSGVEYIHKLGIVHRDLKPENLLLDHNKNIKIADFGLSNTYLPGELLKTACGSPCYAAPEMIAGRRYHGLRVDIWSSGVVLFAMLCGFLPFEDPNTAQLYRKIRCGDYQCPQFLSVEARDLIRGMLTTDPETRFSIEDIRRHPWFGISKEDSARGFFPANGKFLIDPVVVQTVASLGIATSDCVQSYLEANKHNSVTTAYFLFLKKRMRDANISGSPDTTMYSTSPTKFEMKNQRLLEISHRRNGSTGGSASKDAEELCVSVEGRKSDIVAVAPNPPPQTRGRGASHRPVTIRESSPRGRASASVTPSVPLRPVPPPREPERPKPQIAVPRPPNSVHTARGGLSFRKRAYIRAELVQPTDGKAQASNRQRQDEDSFLEERGRSLVLSVN